MRSVMLLLASDPSYGKVHNVLYCYAYFLPSVTLQKVKRDDLWIFRK